MANQTDRPSAGFSLPVDCVNTGNDLHNMARNQETNEQNAALLAVGTRPDVMIWRNQTGVFRSMDDPSRVVKVGMAGAPDALGVVMVTITADMVGQTIGVAIAPEFKTAKGKASERQNNWSAAFRKRGGIYRLIRSPTELINMIGDVKNGKWD